MEKIVTVPKETQGSASAFTVKALEELSLTGGTLRFEPGVYHFFASDALHAPFAVINNGMDEKAIAFPLLFADHVTVDGNGSRFVFHEGAFPFIVSGSKNVTLRDFTVDTALSPTIFAKAASVGETGFTLALEGDLPPFAIEDGSLIFDREGRILSGRERRFSLHGLDKLNIKYLFSGDCRSPKSNLAAPFVSADALSLDGRMLSFCYREDTGIRFPYALGEPFALNLAENRDVCAFFFEDSENVTVENVCIRRFGGMGFVGSCAKDVVLRDITTADAFPSLTADAFHFVNCSGALLLENCRMGGFLDDAINVHGVYGVLEDLRGDTLHGKFGHKSHRFFKYLKDGDEVVFIDPATREIKAHAIVSAMTFDKETGMTFTAQCGFIDGADALEKGFLIEDPARMPDVTVRGCRFSDYPHIRLSGGGKIVVENNVFERTAAGLVVHDLAQYWYESGRVHDVTVRNNIFRSANALGGSAVVDIGVPGFEPDKMPIVHENVRIVGNRLEGACGIPVNAHGVKGLVFEGNTVVPPETT